MLNNQQILNSKILIIRLFEKKYINKQFIKYLEKNSMICTAIFDKIKNKYYLDIIKLLKKIILLKVRKFFYRKDNSIKV
tara:strand:+ start:54 stop:290 length:237 start_codon:yes stop_codon:yes gene_type:complete